MIKYKYIIHSLGDAIKNHHYKKGLELFKLCIEAKTNMKFIVGSLSEQFSFNKNDTRFMLAQFIKTARYKMTYLN
jgi:hypothetical protein